MGVFSFPSLVSVLTGEINVNFGNNLKGLDKVDGIPLLHCAGDGENP